MSFDLFALNMYIIHIGANNDKRYTKYPVAQFNYHYGSLGDYTSGNAKR